MEPISLTCPKCQASWKLIKAGKGPITCPQCKAPLDAPPGESGPTAPTPAATASPAGEDPAPTPATLPQPVPGLTPSAALPPMSIPDTDDPGLASDFDDRFEPARRTRTHPLLKVIIVILILTVLVPVAVVILFLAVCAMLIAAR